MNRNQVLARIEKDAPLQCAASWDTSGIQVRGTRENITRMAMALDPSPETVGKALDLGADLVLTHHPLGLQPRFPNQDDDMYQTMAMLMRSGVWLYAAHTSLDSQPDGPPSWLADALGLRDTHLLEVTGKKTSLLIRIHSREVTEVLSHPNITSPARHGDMHEFVVWNDAWPVVRDDLHAVFGHAFAWQSIPLQDPSHSFGFGCIGDLDHAETWAAFKPRLAAILGKEYWTRIGSPPQTISRVAYCPGSGASLAKAAFAGGAQIYITGDIKYHQAQEIEHAGLTLDVGHHVLEEHMMRVWHDQLQRDLGSRGVEIFFVSSTDPLCIESGKTPISAASEAN